MSKRKRVYDDDDGRTIAEMNVEGMPWYDRSIRERREREAGKEPMNCTQRNSTIFAVVTASLLIALVFGIGYFLVILFMDLLMK